MPDPTPTRRFQFSLRTLLVVVTLCAVACSWMAVKIQQARRQREAVEAIVELGGSIRGTKDGGIAVYLGDTKVTDAELEYLKSVPKLQALWLDDTQITDAGLERLKGLTELNFLELRNTPHVTDAGVKKLLKELPKCKIWHDNLWQ